MTRRIKHDVDALVAGAASLWFCHSLSYYAPTLGWWIYPLSVLMGGMVVGIAQPWTDFVVRDVTRLFAPTSDVQLLPEELHATTRHHPDLLEEVEKLLEVTNRDPEGRDGDVNDPRTFITAEDTDA